MRNATTQLERQTTEGGKAMLDLTHLNADQQYRDNLKLVSDGMRKDISFQLDNLLDTVKNRQFTLNTDNLYQIGA